MRYRGARCPGAGGGSGAVGQTSEKGGRCEGVGKQPNHCNGFIGYSDRVCERVCGGTSDHFNVGALGYRRTYYGSRQRVHWKLYAGERRRLCIRYEPHASYFRLGTFDERCQSRQFCKEDHISGNLEGGYPAAWKDHRDNGEG